MNIGEVFDDLIESKLLEVNTAFIGKVLGVKNGKAKVQPLSLFKTYGGEAKQAAVIEEVLIPKSLYKIELFDWEQQPPAGDHPTHKHPGHVRLVPVQAGDIVACTVFDRDISETQNGTMALPALGHHEISNCMITHIISDF